MRYKLDNQELPFISIIIPIWNSYNRTIECLSQLEKWNYSRDKIEIIIQDNGSNCKDGFEELKKNISYYRNEGWMISLFVLKKHPGLTKALNIALLNVQEKSQYIVRLDNDVELDSEALLKMTRYMENNDDIGVIGPKIYYKKQPNKINASAIYLNKFGFKNSFVDSDIPVDCDTLLGAIMFFRKEAIQKVGRWFDPSLYLFAEEGEFCWQLKQKKYRVVYFPDAIAFHDTAVSTGKHSKLSLYLNHRNNIVVYNRITTPYQSLIRNFIFIFLYLYRSIKTFDFFYLKVLQDGLSNKKLSDDWWQKNIISNKFKFPE